MTHAKVVIQRLIWKKRTATASKSPGRAKVADLATDPSNLVSIAAAALDNNHLTPFLLADLKVQLRFPDKKSRSEQT